MDLNYFYFINGNYQYVVYSEYYAYDDSYKCGIKVINLKSENITNIKGDMKTIKGTLVDFRFNDKIEKTDELFE